MVSRKVKIIIIDYWGRDEKVEINEYVRMEVLYRKCIVWVFYVCYNKELEIAWFK